MANQQGNTAVFSLAYYQTLQEMVGLIMSGRLGNSPQLLQDSFIHSVHYERISIAPLEGD